MNGQELKDARLRRRWTQQQAAEKLGVTQAYLSMLEHGRRVLPFGLARKAVEVLQAPPTALPLREATLGSQLELGSRGSSSSEGSRSGGNQESSEKFRAQLAALGYPGFAHLRGRRRNNPAEVLLTALNESDLDSRVVEGLPWLVLRYTDLDWDWLVQNAKVSDRQNRLGFVATLASQLAAKSAEAQRSRKLAEYVQVLERSRLVREDTLCHDSMTEAERKWLRANRPAEAKHWNLLTDMKAETLPHASL